jgi:hypothetical protein|tara:strand:+ start:101 stop:445 length:345 start_codon:yes stop_codon:yes gene_type:complete
MNERWKPYIRYDKKEDRWISKAIRVDQERDDYMEEIMEKSQVNILMDKEQLDVISRIVAYLYHDKKDEFEEIASDMRKEHIYKDLRSIDIWLNSQYKRLESQNEQSEQKKREHL